MSNNQIVPVPENFDNTQFPEGLRVLAVDDDPICLRILEGLLLKCRYKVTATSDITEAYEMLKQNKNNFDIVITDLYKHDQTNFSLLKAISLEMDLPVVMISAQDDTSTVMKGIMHGVTSYLLKPVRVEELMNIWQHVVRKSLSNPNSSKSSTPEVVTAENPFVCPVKDSKEKEDANNSSGGDDDIGTSQKKPRIAWTQELHLKFLDAIEKLGGSNSLDAVPKKILSLMKKPGLGEENIASQLQLLSRENVASHLQKYRKMLKQGKTLRTSQESYSGADSNQMHSSLTFDNGRLPNIMSGLNGHNSSGCSIPKDAPMLPHLGSNSNSSFQFQNQPNVMLQAYPQISQFQSRDHPPQISQIIDQNRPLRFGPRMPNNLMQASPSFQSYSANTEPYPSAPKLVYQPPPRQMLGGAPTAIIQIPDQKNLVMPIQSYKPGQSCFVPSQNMAIGQHEYDSSSFGAWGSTGNGQINSFQPFQDNIETESNLDDEFTSMIDQFKNNDPPQL